MQLVALRTRARLSSGQTSPLQRARQASASRCITAMAQSTLISDTSSYQAQLKSLLDKPAPHYVVFSSDLDANTKLPWCPDCVRTLPAIQEGVAAAGGSLLEVRVGARTEWRDQQHPFRVDPELQLRGIPTLVHVKSDGSVGQRAGPELERASGPEEAAKIVAQFISSTRS